GEASQNVSAYANQAPASPIYGRLLVATGLAAGQHTVVLTVNSGICLFDFLQAAVLSDPPTPATSYTNSNLAVDFDTGAACQRPPAAVLWTLQQAGFTGDLDFYAGVFFALKRVRYGGNFHKATITISGSFNFGALDGHG